MFNKSFRQNIAAVLLSLFALMQISPAYAGMLSNDELLGSHMESLSVDQLVLMVEREDVQQQLVELGVDPDMAKQRISQLSDAEVRVLSQHMNELPAGSGVLGTVVLIFIVFIVTDMLGATDVFPFVKNINK